MNEKTLDQVTTEATEVVQVEPAKIDVETLIKEQIERFVEQKRQKAIRKGSIWYQGKKIPATEWEQLSYEERLKENNIIKKSRS